MWYFCLRLDTYKIYIFVPGFFLQNFFCSEFIFRLWVIKVHLGQLQKYGIWDMVGFLNLFLSEAHWLGSLLWYLNMSKYKIYIFVPVFFSKHFPYFICWMELWIWQPGLDRNWLNYFIQEKLLLFISLSPKAVVWGFLMLSKGCLWFSKLVLEQLQRLSQI